MISEKDRSEAVTSLRLALSYMLDYEDWYKANDSLFKCGNAAYREIAAAVCKGRRQGSYFDTVKRIIELAERPKSVMESLGDLKFEGKMRDKGTANCFSSISQSAGIYDLIKQKSFYEMMKDSAKMFS